ncbi:MAG: AI-2E family transporter [Rickettsiales bacterium]
MTKENNQQIDKYKPTNARTGLFWLVIAVLFLVFIYLIRGVLLPFVLGALIAYFLDPAADRLEKLKFSRTSATAIITLSFFSVIVILSLLIIPTIVSQLSGLLNDLPTYFTNLETKYEEQISSWIGTLPEGYIENIKSAASGFSGSMVKFAGDLAGGLFQSGMAIINVLSLILITPVVAFYLLRDWDVMTLRFHALLPRKHEKTIREQLSIIDATLAGFIRGQINVCLMLSAFYAIGLSIVGLKFGILIGIATGFLVILPYVGLMFGMGIGLIVAFFQFGDLNGVLQVLAVFVIGQILEGNFVTPKLVGEKVGLHPAWVIFGLLAGAALFGFVGMLIAVPVTAIIGVLIRFALSRYLNSNYYHDDTSSETKLLEH